MKSASNHTDSLYERIEQDTDRDFYMSAQERREYGLIDGVLTKRKPDPR
jgi:ATP-dependent Clp protease protease subunit